jgi:hypothetical protein
LDVVPRKEDEMRVSTRSVVVVALAAAGALALGTVALGAGNSTATFQFTPDQVPKDAYAKGSLFVHTHTDYTGGTKTLRAQLNFDNDLKITTAGIPQCNKASVSGTLTLQQAMAACGNAKVGAGTAQANLISPGDVHGCVLAFNGKPSSGNPTLLLFTRLQVPGSINCSNPASNTNGNGSVLLEGVIRPASGDFGMQLDVNNIPQASPLSDFKTTVSRGNYISARCHDANRQWNLRTTFTYTNPSSTQTVNASQTCQVAQGPPPPNTQITRAKISQRRKKAKFNFRATGNATGFECQLERKRHKLRAFSSCVSPKVYKHLRKGRYTFEVRAVGPGGKDPSPAEKSFRIRRR